MTVGELGGEEDCKRVPCEIWQQVFSFLDLATQRCLTMVCRDFRSLVSSLWRVQLLKLRPGLQRVDTEFRVTRARLVLASLLLDYSATLEDCAPSGLFTLLSQHRHLLQPASPASREENYDYFHHYDRTGARQLELSQKWPRPGSKSLARFLAGNPSLVCLEVRDCRENIEAVHHLLSHCPGLQAVRLLATDPLLPYTELLALRHLQFIEITADSFYRDHRDEFLAGLCRLPELRVLKLKSCYGMTDHQVLQLLQNCPRLQALHLPFNSKISGWFLESVEELLSSRITGLTDLTVHINTAYTMSGNLSVIPEPFADIIKQNLKTQGLLLNIHFVNKKLSSFNPKDFYV